MKLWKYMQQSNRVQFCRPIREGELLQAPQAVLARASRLWERAGKDMEKRFVPIYDEHDNTIVGYIDALGKFVQMQQ